MAIEPPLTRTPQLNLEAGFTRAFEYNASGYVIYEGWAVSATADKSLALWRIARYTYDGSNRLTDIEWAEGDESFTNIWDNRASLNYS